MSENEADFDVVHCVLVGDCAVGKTNLIISYATDQFNINHVPTVFDHYTCDI
jgi:GTPase SAR1 family protein